MVRAARAGCSCCCWRSAITSDGAWRGSGGGCRRARTASGIRLWRGAWRCRSGSAGRGVRVWFAPGAAYLWLLPLLAAGLLLVDRPVANAALVRVASRRRPRGRRRRSGSANTVDLLRFVVAMLGRLPIVTPVFVYAAVMAAAGADGRAAARRRDRARHGRCCGRRSATALLPARDRRRPPASPTRRRPTPTSSRCGGIARAVQEGDGPAVWEVASVEPGLDLGDGAPADWTPCGDAPPASRAVRHAAASRSSSAPTGPSLGPAPIAIAALDRRAGRRRHRARR